MKVLFPVAGVLSLLAYQIFQTMELLIHDAVQGALLGFGCVGLIYSIVVLAGMKKVAK